MYILSIFYPDNISNINTLYCVESELSKLTKEMQAASSKILTNRSSNCSTTNSQIVFPVGENG